MTLDIADLRPWIGRQETVADTLWPWPAAAMAALLDQVKAPRPGDPLPPLWHWVYFLAMHPQSRIAEDGHARRGDFIPPIGLPRRMFAGARLTFSRPLRIDEEAQRTSTIAGIESKAGRSGELILLKIRHEVATAAGPAMVEEHDIVYRDRPRDDAPVHEPRHRPTAPVWRAKIHADVAMLFRYSALLFSAHRIHYDRPFALAAGYPGLVVHGQLIATLLAELVRRHDPRPLVSFGFRSCGALYDTAPFVICGAPAGERITLWAEDQDGAVAMQAEAQVAAH